MPRGYGQYCPFAIAAELLCQRWTLLVVSRVLDGCTRFNEIHAGVPKMSTALLSRRLDELKEAGLLTSRPAPSAFAPYERKRSGRERRLARGSARRRGVGVSDGA